jgi:hypothetical protein
VFHSFRHSFKDACRRAAIPEEIHDAITRHSGGGGGPELRTWCAAQGAGRGGREGEVSRTRTVVSFERWATPEDAEADLLRSALLAFEN